MWWDEKEEALSLTNFTNIKMKIVVITWMSDVNILALTTFLCFVTCYFCYYFPFKGTSEWRLRVLSSVFILFWTNKLIDWNAAGNVCGGVCLCWCVSLLLSVCLVRAWHTLAVFLCKALYNIQSLESAMFSLLSADAKTCSYAQRLLSQWCFYANHWPAALLKTVSDFWRPLTWCGS